MNEETTSQTIARLRQNSPWNADKSHTPKTVNRAFNPGSSRKTVTIKIRGRGVGRRIPVRCIETGQIYPSANAASQSIGLASNAVTCALTRQRSGKAKLAKAAGLTWEYVLENQTS